MTHTELTRRLEELERDRRDAQLQDDFAFSNGTIREIDQRIWEVTQLLQQQEARDAA